MRAEVVWRPRGGSPTGQTRQAGLGKANGGDGSSTGTDPAIAQFPSLVKEGGSGEVGLRHLPFAICRLPFVRQLTGEILAEQVKRQRSNVNEDGPQLTPHPSRSGW